MVARMSRSVALALLLLGGCAGPVVTGASPQAVTVKYDPLPHSRQDVVAEAARQCAAMGGGAPRYVSTSQDGPIGWRYDTFACDGEVSP